MATKGRRGIFLNFKVVNSVYQLDYHSLGSPGGSDNEESAGTWRDPGSIPGSRRSPGEGNGNLLQYSCWEIPWTEEPGGL